MYHGCKVRKVLYASASHVSTQQGFIVNLNSTLDLNVLPMADTTMCHVFTKKRMYSSLSSCIYREASLSN
jgi:hypothetical protein